MRVDRYGRLAALSGVIMVLLSGGRPGLAQTAVCDEYDPGGPMRGAAVTLGPDDLVEAGGNELRSFIATGSIGRVEASIITTVPRGVAAGVAATPEVSRFSPDYGEALKGIAVAVRLMPGGRAQLAKIVIGLRQVCARYFRNTFLYY